MNAWPAPLGRMNLFGFFPEGAALGYDGPSLRPVGFQEGFTWIILLAKRRVVV